MPRVRALMTNDELLALLRDDSLRPESIAEEIECSGATRPRPPEVSTARELLEALRVEAVAQTVGLEGPDAGEVARRIAALPDCLSLPLIHAAGNASRQEVLRELAVAGNKALAKDAKRELQRLKQRGVQVQELRPHGEAVLRPMPEAEVPASYASSIDSYGERAVWWTRPARSGVEVVQVVLSDLKGIVAIDAMALSRRSYREFVKRLPRQPVVTTAEISREHARQLIAEAETEGMRNGFAPPEAYVQALRILGPAPHPPPPSPGAAVPLEDEAAHAMAGAALFEDPLFTAWIPEEDTLRQFALRVDEIATSQLYVDARQKRQQLERTAEDFAQGYFTPQRRARYGRRLLEMAHVLHHEGRIDAARTALAVSRALERDAGNPFCRALFSHAIRDRFQAEDEAPAAAPEPPGLIVP